MPPAAVLEADEASGQEYEKEGLTNMCKPKSAVFVNKSWSEGVSA